MGVKNKGPNENLIEGTFGDTIKEKSFEDILALNKELADLKIDKEPPTHLGKYIVAKISKIEAKIKEKSGNDKVGNKGNEYFKFLIDYSLYKQYMKDVFSNEFQSGEDMLKLIKDMKSYKMKEDFQMEIDFYKSIEQDIIEYLEKNGLLQENENQEISFEGTGNDFSNIPKPIRKLLGAYMTKRLYMYEGLNELGSKPEDKTKIILKIQKNKKSAKEQYSITDFYLKLY